MSIVLHISKDFILFCNQSCALSHADVHVVPKFSVSVRCDCCYEMFASGKSHVVIPLVSVKVILIPSGKTLDPKTI